jgi:hypothetical protein
MLDPHQREEKRRKNIAKRIAKTININKVILDIGLLLSGGPEPV